MSRNGPSDPTDGSVASDPDRDPFVRANQALWEEWTRIHKTSEFYDLAGFVRDLRAGRDRMRRFEVEEVGEVAGRRMLHPMCHLGTDTLLWARRGAAVTGIDSSPSSIEVAESLARDLGIDAEFIQADVYDMGRAVQGRFDIIYMSHGVLGWLPDLIRLATVIADLLDQGGVFYLAEIHPFPLTLDRFEEGGRELQFKNRYFPHRQPLAFPVAGSYADRAAAVQARTQYRWPHSLGELVTEVTKAGLRLEFLHEFPFMVYQGLSILERRDDGLWWLPERLGIDLPLSFSLRAVKA